MLKIYLPLRARVSNGVYQKQRLRGTFFSTSCPSHFNDSRILNQVTPFKRFPLGATTQNSTKGEFQPLTAIHSSFIEPTPYWYRYERLHRWSRRLLFIGGVGIVGYWTDKYFNASTITRTIRSFIVLITIAIDYKINFVEDYDIDKLHERNAKRLYGLLVKNKGLYIKIGQAMAVQSAIFPPAFQEKFAILFDGAPQDSWKEISNTIHQELGQAPEDVFEYIDSRSFASASIAQVHKAKLKSGDSVAVKVQHAYIKKQMNTDLLTYRMIMLIYEIMFDLPTRFATKYISDQLKKESEFKNEAQNSIEMENLIKNSSSSRLKEKVHIPKVYEEYSTDRVMVTEWIDGVPLKDLKQLRRQNFSYQDIMTTILRLFSKQIFEWGVIHCDPHPGNMIIRRNKYGGTQVVLLDHGLYVRIPKEFRKEYCDLWKSLFKLDHKEITKIAHKWGIGSPDIFGSMVLLRPYSSKTNSQMLKLERLSNLEKQVILRRQFKNFIKDTAKVPLELIFLGRTMNMLQGVNRLMYSPVNRIKIMALKATEESNKAELLNKIIKTDKVSKKLSLYLNAWFHFSAYRLTLLVSDIIFYFIRFKQFILGEDSPGLEEIIERQMIKQAKTLGFQVREGVMFSG